MVQVNTFLALAALAFVPVQSIALDTGNMASAMKASAAIAKGLVKFYKGTEPGEIPGLLPDPYYFWEAGAMWDALIQYQNLTGDNQFNVIVNQALKFQEGENGNFMPANQTKSLGNDDQSTWALASLSAAQENFPGNTGIDQAEAVFNNQVLRWDTASCGGGLRWQLFAFNVGYGYKNAVSNGQFFQLAARLAHYTGNSTYSEWATKVFDWSTEIGLISAGWQVFDGTQVGDGCTAKDHSQWSSSAGTYLVGAATMYSITTGETQAEWKVALDGLLKNILATFFIDGVVEEACESSGLKCNVDQRAFKALLAHQLLDTIRIAPYTSEKLRPVLTASATAAAKLCNDAGEDCMAKWNDESRTTNITGVGEQLSALAYVQAVLVFASGDTTRSGNSTVTPTNSATGSPSGTETTKPTIPANSGAVLGSGNAVIAISGIWALMMLAF